MIRQVFIGPMIHTDENGELIIKKNIIIFIEDGKIIDVMENPIIHQQKIDDFHADKVNDLSHGEFIIPGFIDCHTHAVQFPNLGLGYDKYLLDWLETYTFPLEKKYIDTKFAEQVFEAVVKRTIEAGTTTACYFASLYTEASAILAKKVAELGQRAFIGKINMNTQRSDGYYESTEKSIKDTMAFIESVEQIGNPLVRPIITPRFALSCNMELMQELAKIAKAKGLHIQSHISENEAEIRAVKQIYKEQSSYTAVYDAAGLLTSKTILAHGIHLEDSELAILEKRGTAIIHCPSSNMYLRSGLCDVQRLKAKNIKVGLGTDVSGGSNYSMLDEMRSVLHVSNCLSIMRHDYVPFNYKDVFHMATLGGAKALSIENKVGNLMPGKEFDALIIDLNTKSSLLDNFKEYTLEEKLQRFMYSVDIHCDIEKEESSKSCCKHKRMDPTEDQQTTTYVDNKCLLLLLVNKLKSLPHEMDNDILEVNFLHKFPTYDVILPEVHFSPRRIIEHMIDTHECAKLKMKEKSEFLKIVIYRYCHSSTIEQFQFSNNMSLTADLYTICYFYHVIVTREYYALKIMKDIFAIMLNKYKIKNKWEMKLTKGLNERTITAFRITYSFPSISFPFFGLQSDISKSVPTHPIFAMFPVLNLNKILCCPLVPFVMPKLNSNSLFIPMAFLLAINIQNNQILKTCPKYPNYPDMSVNVIYQRILELHASTAFPTSLKLQLCQKWGFVEMKQGNYKYADYFIEYQQKALDIILQLKSEDPDLHKIISKIVVG